MSSGDDNPYDPPQFLSERPDERGSIGRRGLRFRLSYAVVAVVLLGIQVAPFGPFVAINAGFWPIQFGLDVTEIHLTPVTDRHMKSGYPQWRFRRNALGSILLWANRAGAVKIEFSEDSPSPFTYFDSAGREVETEMGQPPENVRDDLFRKLILSAVRPPISVAQCAGFSVSS